MKQKSIRKERINMKKIFIGTLLAIFIFPITTFAQEDEFKVIAQETKYYKTIIVNSNFNSLNSKEQLNGNSNSVEITKEEYENAPEGNISTYANGSVETTYKRLTTSILNNGSTYRYQANLTWKNIPSTRSYDIIAIGHNSNVKCNGLIYFSQTYCLTNGTCRTLSTHYPKQFSTGVGTSFQVPTGNLKSLSQTLYFDVTKNTSSTITAQYAYGDYSHATSNVSLSQSKQYSVGTSGIYLNGSVEGHYDTIPTAVASWNGSW